LVAGCTTLGVSRTHRANNLYAYLYSDRTEHVDAPTIPVLSLPLRVGTAFVPVDRTGDRRDSWSVDDDSAFSESQKMELMKKINAQFEQYPFIKSIEMIPTAYLTPRGGFANLDQIRQMYGVVGAYVVPGEKNDTKTMLDAAVYDLASRKLLFRAPGISGVKGSATPINLSEELRADSQRGFEVAATNLTANLAVQLEQFKERVKNAPTDYKVEYKPGYTGAGSFGGTETVLLAALGICYLWTQRQSRA
jgi:hypothetical protein